jgi:hypothetical protein
MKIELLSIGPNKFALLGVEPHVLHQITERVHEFGKLLALRRMSPFEEVVKERIVRENTAFQLGGPAPEAQLAQPKSRGTSFETRRGPSNGLRLKPTLPKIAFLERPHLSKL